MLKMKIGICKKIYCAFISVPLKKLQYFINLYTSNYYILYNILYNTYNTYNLKVWYINFENCLYLQYFYIKFII